MRMADATLIILFKQQAAKSILRTNAPNSVHHFVRQVKLPSYSVSPSVRNHLTETIKRQIHWHSTHVCKFICEHQQKTPTPNQILKIFRKIYTLFCFNVLCWSVAIKYLPILHLILVNGGT